MPVACAISADLGADPLDAFALGDREGGEFLVDLGRALKPAVVELGAHIAVEEGLARNAVTLGEAQHLPAKRGQAAVVAVELVDEIFDLGGVELDALDLGGQLLAELLILLLVARRIIGAGAERGEARLLQLGEFLVERGDRRELLERGRLQRLFHLGEGKGVILFLFLDRARIAPLGHVVFLVGDDLFLGLFVFLDRRTGVLLADLVVAAFFALGDLVGRRALRQHRLEIEDLAQLHRAFVEVVRPFDDRVEGDRAFAQAPDHDVAAGLDALGDGDFALAAEQFDRAHLAQIHAHRIVGAVDRFLLDRRGRARPAVVERIDLFLVGLLGLRVLVVAIVILDDIDAHLRQLGHDVLDLSRTSSGPAAAPR